MLATSGASKSSRITFRPAGLGVTDVGGPGAAGSTWAAAGPAHANAAIQQIMAIFEREPNVDTRMAAGASETMAEIPQALFASQLNMLNLRTYRFSHQPASRVP